MSEKRAVQLRAGAVDANQQVPRAIVARFEHDAALEALRAVLEAIRRTRAEARASLAHEVRR